MAADAQVTADDLLWQLAQLVKGTSHAFSYPSQEYYFSHSQRFKEAIREG